MSDLADRTRQAVAYVQGVVNRVCGTCGNSCCHQGTMMGSHDLRRLAKGLALEPGLEQLLRNGLGDRALELRADLETLQAVRRLLAASTETREPGKLGQLDLCLSQWEDFCRLLESPWPADYHTLQTLLRFAGIRAAALRAIEAFPGAQAALSTLARPGSSFRFRGRRLAPPRCLFHSHQHGCLAGSWKPGKCANFFCVGDPNLIRELHQCLSFEDFVLGNARVVDEKFLLAAVALECRLGNEYVDAKIVLGATPELETRLRDLLISAGRLLVDLPGGDHFMLSSSEISTVLESLEPAQVSVARCHSIDGAALYELAIALDQRRAAAEPVPFILLAETFHSPSPLPHPLWTDEEMSQPLGALDLYVLGN